MKPTIKWNGDRVSNEVKAAASLGLRKTGEYLRTEMVKRISKSARGVQGARYPKKGATRPMRLVHSKPGEPPRADTGKLRQSMFWSHDRGQLVTAVGTRIKVGVYMELGTKAHTIVPTKKRMLVFGGWVLAGRAYQTGWRSTWDWVFARRVRHPGTKKRPFIVSTVTMNRDKIVNILADELRKVGASGMASRLRFGR